MAAFDWFPLLEGKYYSYRFYLMLTATTTMILVLLVWLVIAKFIKLWRDKMNKKNDDYDVLSSDIMYT